MFSPLAKFRRMVRNGTAVTAIASAAAAAAAAAIAAAIAAAAAAARYSDLDEGNLESRKNNNLPT